MIVSSLGFTALAGTERAILNLSDYLMSKHNSIELVAICSLEDLQKEVVAEFKQFNIIRYKSNLGRPVNLRMFLRLIFGIEYTNDWKIISGILHKNKNLNNLPDVILTTSLILDVKKALKHEQLNIKVVYWPHISIDGTQLKSLKYRIRNIFVQFTHNVRESNDEC